MWPQDAPPEVVVMKLDVLDPNGNSIPDQGKGGFSSNSGSGSPGDDGSATSRGSGTCAICDSAATIRYILALDVYEKEVRFAIENVPVPGF